MYGGKPGTLCIETRDKQIFYIDWTPPDFLHLFHKEFQKNSTTLLSLDEFKTYMKDNRNPLGTGMSLLAQDIERQIISVAIQTFNQNEYTTGTIIHEEEPVVNNCPRRKKKRGALFAGTISQS